MLPNSMEREVDWRTMLEERQKEQTKLTTKKGKKSPENFAVGDKVILQETTETKRQWLEMGIIREERATYYGSYQSFNIDQTNMDNV